MSGLIKALTGILGVLAVVACLATIGIIGYSMLGGGNEKDSKTFTALVEEASPVPTSLPKEASGTPIPDAQQIVKLDGHVHDYKAKEEIKATCYQSGRIKYACECGDAYFVDVMSTGHVADDWEVIRKATASQDGLRVKKCIYCDEIMSQENMPFEESGGASGTPSVEAGHVHQYAAETVREPSCVLAGLRKYNCNCGNFYTEMIPAAGHVATDWDVASEPTNSRMGTEQRTCTVCGVVLDSRPIPALKPTPSASETPAANTAASAAPGSSGEPAATTAPQATAEPSPTPHEHDYASYVLKEANCTEKGIRSFVCNCGSSKAESIELDLNNHTFRAVIIPATATTQGYTVYTCIRCNYSYFDDYTPALSN